VPQTNVAEDAFHSLGKSIKMTEGTLSEARRMQGEKKLFVAVQYREKGEVH